MIFKGKQIDNGEWTYGYLFRIWERAYILWGSTNDVPNMIEVDPETVCKSTGRPDKNGRKIFEGDIVQYSKIGVLGKVVWYEDDYIGFAVDDIDDSIQLFDKELFGKVEVIGNIFDNPELLERN